MRTYRCSNKDQEDRDRCSRLMTWHKKFAWLPKRIRFITRRPDFEYLHHTGWLWFEYYMRKWEEGYGYVGPWRKWARLPVHVLVAMELKK